MNYQIIIFTGTGIGNVIEALYSIEYCLDSGINCGICLENIPQSFRDYLSQCYPGIIVRNSEDIYGENIIHSWLFTEKIQIRHTNYIYVAHDLNSVQYVSEDESFLHIVKSIVNSKVNVVKHLTRLIESKPDVFKDDFVLRDLYAIYFGSSALSPTKRWPHFEQLIHKLGENNVILVGGNDDLNYKYSFRYPNGINKWFNKKVTNNYLFWKYLKQLGLLVPHAHLNIEKFQKNAFINKFSWSELVYIFRRVRAYIGNDGGLSHLASAANVKKGVVIFGPSSIQKNKPYNYTIKSISTNLNCQPCYFSVEGIHMGKEYINCPYGIKCLDEIKPEKIIQTLNLV